MSSSRDHTSCTGLPTTFAICAASRGKVRHVATAKSSAHERRVYNDFLRLQTRAPCATVPCTQSGDCVGAHTSASLPRACTVMFIGSMVACARKRKLVNRLDFLRAVRRAPHPRRRHCERACPASAAAARKRFVQCRRSIPKPPAPWSHVICRALRGLSSRSRWNRRRRRLRRR